MWKLIDQKTGSEINIGAEATTFRGEPVRLIAMRPPHKPSSEGHVTVRFLNGSSQYEHEFYAGVIGASYVRKIV